MPFLCPCVHSRRRAAPTAGLLPVMVVDHSRQTACCHHVAPAQKVGDLAELGYRGHYRKSQFGGLRPMSRQWLLRRRHIYEVPFTYYATSPAQHGLRPFEPGLHEDSSPSGCLALRASTHPSVPGADGAGASRAGAKVCAPTNHPDGSTPGGC
jgi:hypothetical protein